MANILRIGIPVMQNGLVTVALLNFVGAWNNFFFPLIVLSQENLYPLTLVYRLVNNGDVVAFKMGRRQGARRAHI
jgi:ABC-type glycerol-3-phosphate transport system permease component